MTTLLVGFDSAWTRTHSGALASVLRLDDGTFKELGPPQKANFGEAESTILGWQNEQVPAATIVMLDQPTIVKNETGQRCVENLVASPVSLRYGGMQPASLSRMEMFGKDAPLWPFLDRFGGAANPLAPVVGTRVFETYPVLAMIALGWTLPDAARGTGRLPKYNPARRTTFCLSDWCHVCDRASGTFRELGILGISGWIDAAANGRPRKTDQDCLDACLCLIVALHLAEGKDCLMVGDLETGYIVVPDCVELHWELVARCNRTGREPSEWVRAFSLQGV